MSNLETGKRKLLQIVLFGQPELDVKLNQAASRQLNQRIVFHYRLTLLKREDIEHYVAHRLGVARYTGGESFGRAAIRQLYDASGGIPRLVNIIAQQGRTPEAITGLEQALRIDPRHAAATQTLIALLLESKRFGEAERKLQEALSLDLAQPDLAMTLARLQLERGDTAAAIATLDRSQHAAANRPEYYGFMAALLRREGYHREAIVQYRQALRLAPGNAVWLMGLGISLQAEKNYLEAREAYSRASGSLSPELRAFVEQRLRQLGQAAN